MSAERKRVYGELGTVYAKCGGIFGVSAFADRCMDKWMADATLNANEAVATWHQKAQRCGFKFLVVQILGNLTGGPQRYTGRPIDEAHKHLNISGEEWDRFMEIFYSVCEEFQLPDDLVGDLTALMISMEFDCVVQPGETAPRDPGPALPRGSSLYARCGGVYPLALFADRVVDALLQDERICIPCDGQKRNEASLKYLFTELMCSASGGPEVITAGNFEETMLLLPKAAWEVFIATVQVAADHLPAAVRAELVQCVQRSKALIVDPNSDGAALPGAVLGNSGLQASAKVKSLQAAASGKMLSSAAIAARHAAPGAQVDARRRVMGDPRTLYGRGGGVFGLAKLADALMDAWMTDPALNANVSVAKWHESQQKLGFKFLVTQLLGYLTGGPQRYTGVSMESAHKHLAITSEQWNSFVADAAVVFEKLGVDPNTQSDLLAILTSFQDQCVLQRGEAAPSDPGLCRARPAGNLAYSQLGGVYPLALFADRLVDKVLQEDRVRVQWDRLDDPNGTRHPPGLKYMVTELLCHSAGGPEMPTSRGFEEAKLGVDPCEWPAFLEVVAETAAIWPTKHHRELILKVCEKSKVEICFGLEGIEMPHVDMEPESAALPLVTSGGCPFSGKSSGKCPFSSGQMDAVARALPKKFKVGQDEVKQPTAVINETVPMPMGGRILGCALQQKLDRLTEENPDFCCPVSLMVFKDPVIASDGFVYDLPSLTQLLANRLASPMTREPLKPLHRAAKDKLAEVTIFRNQRSQELVEFAAEAVSDQPQLAITALDRASEYIAVLEPFEVRDLIANAVLLYGQLDKPVPHHLSKHSI
jgi:hemoglobin